MSQVSREDPIIWRTEECFEFTLITVALSVFRHGEGGRCDQASLCPVSERSSSRSAWRQAGGRAPDWQLTLPVVDSCLSLLAFDLCHPCVCVMCRQ